MVLDVWECQLQGVPQVCTWKYLVLFRAVMHEGGICNMLNPHCDGHIVQQQAEDYQIGRPGTK